MSTAQAIEFMQKTAEDETLRQEVESLLGVGDGDISSIDNLDAEEAQALKGKRGSLVIELAGKNGFEFSVDELITVVDAFEKCQSGELSSEEFAQIKGLTDFNQKSRDRLLWIKKAIQFFLGDRTNENPASHTGNAIAQGATANVIEFMEKTAEDDELKAQVESLLEVGDGDISCHHALAPQEAQALKSKRGALVVELAAQYGFYFSQTELISVVEALENHKSKVLDRESLMMHFIR